MNAALKVFGIAAAALAVACTHTSVSGGSRLVILDQPQAIAAGALISPAIRVGVQRTDGRFDVVPLDSVSLTAVTSDGSKILVVTCGTTKRRFVDAVATFDDLRLEQAGVYVLRASANGFLPVSTSSFEVSGPSVDIEGCEP